MYQLPARHKFESADCALKSRNRIALASKLLDYVRILQRFVGRWLILHCGLKLV